MIPSSEKRFESSAQKQWLCRSTGNPVQHIGIIWNIFIGGMIVWCWARLNYAGSDRFEEVKDRYLIETYRAIETLPFMAGFLPNLSGTAAASDKGFAPECQGSLQ
jgi:hypothetical protein